MTACHQLLRSGLRPGRHSGALSAFVFVAAVSASFATPVWAQSAADKATARELATEGIKKLEQGDAAGAVKSLEKAQALYDAPIHLLFLGRAHTKLGNLVEAAEAYRSLGRAKLESDAPAAFKKAQSDGAVELEALEPRLAKLTIEVTPEVDGLEVTVDDKPINTAALSVPRATNPGKRIVRARAPGYLSAQAEVTLEEGGVDTVSLTLEEGQDPDAPLGEESGGAALTAGTGTGEGDAASGDDKKSGPMGFILGVRGGVVLPVGQLQGDVSATDYFQAGPGGRGEVGFRFLHNFGIKGYLGFGALSPGGGLDDFAEQQEESILAKNSGSFTDAGVALMGTTDPRILGGFGEIGFSFLHEYRWVQNFSSSAVECGMEARYKGWAVRAGGGMNIPTGRLLDIVPAVDVSVGQFGEPQTDSTCNEPTDDGAGIEGADTRFDVDFQKALHFQIFLGIGADLHFGDGLFR